MLLLSFSAQMAPSPNHCATSAALRCLFAYSRELENCQIGVEVADGVIILTGTEPHSAYPHVTHRLTGALTGNSTSGRVRFI
jgi:hypothetical protein